MSPSGMQAHQSVHIIGHDHGTVEQVTIRVEVAKSSPHDRSRFEVMEETEGRGSKFLLRVARLRRAREKFLAELGQVRYEAALAVYQWAIYLALGKLSASLYVLQKTQAR